MLARLGTQREDVGSELCHGLALSFRFISVAGNSRQASSYASRPQWNSVGAV